MATNEALLHDNAWVERRQDGPWLHSRNWDLCFIILSCVLVIIPLALYEISGKSAAVVNIVIAGLIGGPHMYATFFRTALDPSFRQHHRLLIGSSLIIPVLVVGIALWNFQLLLTLFFFWASMHVLHQIAYIVECYERRKPSPFQRLSRIIDYAVVLTCLYPLASYKFIYDEFYIGSTLLLYPEILKSLLVVYLVTGAFLLSMLLFIIKSVIEIQRGVAHYPKILLVFLTVVIALIITSFDGARTEIAFQGFNTWHSFQYLALTWYISALHRRRGNLTSPVMAWLSATGRHRFVYFYGLNIALTVGTLVLILAIVYLVGLPYERSYYIVLLSFLLVHYYHDHLLFTKFGVLTPATSAPSGSS
jgi:hypothetical protein